MRVVRVLLTRLVVLSLNTMLVMGSLVVWHDVVLNKARLIIRVGVLVRRLIEMGQIRVAMHGQVVTDTVHLMVNSLTVMLITVVIFFSVHGNTISLRVEHLVVVVRSSRHVRRRGGTVSRRGTVMRVSNVVLCWLVVSIVTYMTNMTNVAAVAAMVKIGVVSISTIMRKLLLKWAHMVSHIVLMAQVMLSSIRVLIMVESVRLFIIVAMVRALVHVLMMLFMVRLMMVIVVSVLGFMHVLVIVSRFSLDREYLRWVIMLAMMQSLRNIWLHLQHKISIVHIGLRGAESGRVGIERSVVALVPPVCIKCNEIVSPMEVKAVCLVVPSVRFNVVVENVPWHVSCVESLTPALECGCPEVHHDGLSLVHILHRRISGVNTSDLLVVDGPGDVVGSPSHLVNVPVVLGVKALLVLVRLVLGVAITIDYVHAEGVLLDRGHDFNIELIPATHIEVGTIPVGEEG